MENLLKLLLLIVVTLQSSCKKEPEGFPPARFYISFEFVDSLGNNVLPYDLPKNPIINPENFTAYSDRNIDIGSIFRGSNGYFFGIQELQPDIRNDSLYLKDSIITFYPCFDKVCDTIYIVKKNWKSTVNSLSSCSADKVIWGNDTIYNLNCVRILKHI